MKKHLKLLALSFAMLAAGGTLAACGSDNSNSGEPEKTVIKEPDKITDPNKVTYRVTFNMGDDKNIDSQVVLEGDMVKRPTDPIKEGYNFMGWYSLEEYQDENGTPIYEPVEFNFNQPIYEAITLYAKWEEVTKYTVTFDAGDGNVIQKTVQEGNTVERPDDPIKDGYEFLGWYFYNYNHGSNQEFKFDTLIDSSIYVFAKWEKCYTVTFDTGDGSKVDSQKVLEGEKLKKPQDPTREGYEFVCWNYYYYNGYREYNFGSEIYDSFTLYAKWNVISYTVDFDTNGGSSLASQQIDYGETVIRPMDEPTKTGYSFEGWYTDTTYSTPFNFENVITKNTTIYAKWVATVTFITNSNETIDSKQVEIGEVINEPLVSKENGVFLGWYTDDTFAAKYDFNKPVKQNLNLYAKWRASDTTALCTFQLAYEGFYVITKYNGGNNYNVINLPESYNGLSVGAISSNVFNSCSFLTSVTIPDSIQYIGESAFAYCRNLSEIFIPDSVTGIGERAFVACPNLSEIKVSRNNRVYSSRDDNGQEINGIIEINSKTLIHGCKNTIIPDSITKIGEYAFYNCSSLMSITIGSNVTNIARYAFTNCTNLTKVVISDSVTTIGEKAFYNCSNLTSATLGNSITSIAKCAFAKCISLTEIVIPDSVLTLGETGKRSGELGVFEGCYNLTSVRIGCGVEVIGTCTFWQCEKLTSIELPSSVMYVGDDAFNGCKNLTSMNYLGTLDQWVQIDFGNFYSNPTYYTHKLYINGEEITNAVISDSVTKIGGGLSYCKTLTTVTIGNNVTAIGDRAFAGCAGLTEIIIPDNVTSIGSFAFRDCTSLTEIIIPDGVTNIGGFAFGGCTGLTQIIIPDSVESIGWYAFSECKNLKSVTLSNNITSIGNATFDNCSSLTEIIIPDSVISIDQNAFYNCYRLKEITIPDNVTTIGEDAFRYCSSLTSITLGNNVTSIGQYAFYKSGLTKIIIPDSVTNIGDLAFGECSSLTSVNIGNGVTNIGVQAFYNCTELTEIIIPDNVITIGVHAFENWTIEQTIYFEISKNDEVVSSWDSDWKYGCQAKILWSNEWEYVNGVPTPKN